MHSVSKYEKSLSSWLPAVLEVLDSISIPAHGKTIFSHKTWLIITMILPTETSPV